MSPHANALAAFDQRPFDLPADADAYFADHGVGNTTDTISQPFERFTSLEQRLILRQIGVNTPARRATRECLKFGGSVDSATHGLLWPSWCPTRSQSLLRGSGKVYGFVCLKTASVSPD
jgi:hypothetical protein